jgi:hypothetical protein
VKSEAAPAAKPMLAPLCPCRLDSNASLVELQQLLEQLGIGDAAAQVDGASAKVDTAGTQSRTSSAAATPEVAALPP